ncbi:hypothetical protein TNCV_4254561 [Trichonephila clavipes]|nr:hypothetical protein TNCV_4254561 [Trichonephila clavipes]
MRSLNSEKRGDTLTLPTEGISPHPVKGTRIKISRKQGTTPGLPSQTNWTLSNDIFIVYQRLALLVDEFLKSEDIRRLKWQFSSENHPRPENGVAERGSEYDICEGGCQNCYLRYFPTDFSLPSPGSWYGSGGLFILELLPTREWSIVFSLCQRLPVRWQKTEPRNILGCPCI